MALACLSIGFLGTAHCDAAIGDATYGLLSETYNGINYDPNATEELGYLGAWSYPGNLHLPTIVADTSTFTEGGQSLKVMPVDYVSSGIFIMFVSTSTGNQDNANMSAYEGGTLEFDIRSTDDLQIKVEWYVAGSAENGSTVKKLSEYVTVDNTKWQHVSIPLNHFATDLSAIRVPAGFHSLYGDFGRSYNIDNIVWRKASGGTFDMTLRNIGNNAVASELTWSDIDLGNTRWKAADQYLELDVTLFSGDYRNDIDAWPYGIQIYTDNTNAAASPRYTGTGDPAGLVDMSTTTRTLPMCWRIVDQSTTTHIMQGATDAITGQWLPGRLWENQLTDQYPCYIWMRDKQSSDFENGMAYATAWDYRGIQHAEMTFGGARSPNYVYFCADFSQAVGPRSYRTGRLIVELYNE